tara:strand:+ start:1123 stop:1371 length:249 start_codon:yes stop_codon:yes gene_type:complete
MVEIIQVGVMALMVLVVVIPVVVLQPLVEVVDHMEILVALQQEMLDQVVAVLVLQVETVLALVLVETVVMVHKFLQHSEIQL